MKNAEDGKKADESSFVSLSISYLFLFMLHFVVNIKCQCSQARSMDGYFKKLTATSRCTKAIEVHLFMWKGSGGKSFEKSFMGNSCAKLRDLIKIEDCSWFLLEKLENCLMLLEGNWMKALMKSSSSFFISLFIQSFLISLIIQSLFNQILLKSDSLLTFIWRKKSEKICSIR